MLINNKALIVRYKGSTTFRLRSTIPRRRSVMDAIGEPNYRELKEDLQKKARATGFSCRRIPTARRSPCSTCRELRRIAPSREHIFGTDDRGRDVFARLAYGFNVSLTFALLVTAISEGIRGHCRARCSGYFGGKLDILGNASSKSGLPFRSSTRSSLSVRSSFPFILPGEICVLQPSFWLLIAILVVFDWMGITYYVRGEFYREKAKDYVGAAIAMGVSEPAIMFRHILPNALTPVVSFAPFTIVGEYQRTCRAGFPGLWIAGANTELGRIDRCKGMD